VHPDDFGKVFGGEAVGAADSCVRYQAPTRPVLDPPSRAAERLGDLFGTVEAGQGSFALCSVWKAREGRRDREGRQEVCVLTGEVLGRPCCKVALGAD